MGSGINLCELRLDWNLAIRRLRKDLRDEFWPDPLGMNDFLGSPETIVDRLEPQLTDYSPRRACSYAVPKANFTIRDSIYLNPLDRLVYQALVDQLIPAIDPVLSKGVFSFRLRGADSEWMFENPVKQSQKFRAAVKSALDRNRGGFLVVTDITQYFELIRFRTVQMQLEKILGDLRMSDLQACVEVLMKCLRGWSPYDGYGLVQNVEVSSFLGNLVLDHVDKLMERAGYPIIRYMDDIRISVADESEARKALMKLSALLRDLSLGLNAEKTAVIEPASPRLKTYLPDEDPEIQRIEDALEKKTRQDVQGIVETLFSKAIKLVKQNRCGESVFRFCLHRIAGLRAYRGLDLPNGEVLTDAVLAMLPRRPAETDTLCRYLEVAPLDQKQSDELIRLLVHERLCVYDWQNFHLWRLVSQRGLTDAALTRRAHFLLERDPTGPEAAAAALYLGARGDYADRQLIAKILRNGVGGLSARCFQVAIQELHKAERKPVYAEVSASDPNSALLTAYLESLREPVYVERPPKIEMEDLSDMVPSVYG
jgi:hypothetical protein